MPSLSRVVLGGGHIALLLLVWLLLPPPLMLNLLRSLGRQARRPAQALRRSPRSGLPPKRRQLHLSSAMNGYRFLI